MGSAEPGRSDTASESQCCVGMELFRISDTFDVLIGQHRLPQARSVTETHDDLSLQIWLMPAQQTIHMSLKTSGEDFRKLGFGGQVTHLNSESYTHTFLC